MRYMPLLFAFLLCGAVPAASGHDGVRPSTLRHAQGRPERSRGATGSGRTASAPLRAELVEARTDASPSAPLSAQYPIPVDLMTVIDQAAVLGGQRVRVREVRVKEVVGPRLVIVGHHRRRDFDITYEPAFPLDKLLVLLPPSLSASPGELMAVTGIVRTVSGARSLGLPVVLDTKHAKTDPKRAVRFGNRPLLVADSVETVDGATVGR